jgi:hypothetical protein
MEDELNTAGDPASDALVQPSLLSNSAWAELQTDIASLANDLSYCDETKDVVVFLYFP